MCALSQNVCGCVGKPVNQMMCETVVFGGPVKVTISPCTDMMIRSASWTFNGKTCDIHQKCTKPFSSFQILVSDHLASLFPLSCYLPWAGATLKLKNISLQFFFFCLWEKSLRPIFVSLQKRKTIDWSSAHCNRTSGLFLGEINAESGRVSLAAVLRRGWILETRTLTRVNRNNEKCEVTSDQLCGSCTVSAWISFPSSLICPCTHTHTHQHAGYLHCNAMLHQLSRLPPLSPLCSFTGFPQHNAVPPQTSCTHL